MPFAALWIKQGVACSALKIVNQLLLIDTFSQDISDGFLSPKKRPSRGLSKSISSNWILWSAAICPHQSTPSRTRDRKHLHIQRTDEVPLTNVTELGKGGYGYVDRVISNPLSPDLACYPISTVDLWSPVMPQQRRTLNTHPSSAMRRASWELSTRTRMAKIGGGLMEMYLIRS